MSALLRALPEETLCRKPFSFTAAKGLSALRATLSALLSPPPGKGRFAAVWDVVPLSAKPGWPSSGPPSSGPPSSGPLLPARAHSGCARAGVAGRVGKASAQSATATPPVYPWSRVWFLFSRTLDLGFIFVFCLCLSKKSCLCLSAWDRPLPCVSR